MFCYPGGCDQVGPVWQVSDTQQGSKFQMYLSSPSNATVIAPYNVTVVADAPYDKAYPWQWDATVTPEGHVSPFLFLGLILCTKHLHMNIWCAFLFISHPPAFWLLLRASALTILPSARYPRLL